MSTPPCLLSESPPDGCPGHPLGLPHSWIEAGSRQGAEAGVSSREEPRPEDGLSLENFCEDWTGLRGEKHCNQSQVNFTRVLLNE